MFTDEGIEAAAEQFWQDINSRYEEYCVDPERPILDPSELFMPVDQIFHEIKKLPRTILNYQGNQQKTNAPHSQIYPVPDVSVNAKQPNPLSKLQSFIGSYSGQKQPLKILFYAKIKRILITNQL